MDKQELIELLIKKESEASEFASRFVRTHKNHDKTWFNDWWTFITPCIDCFEPQLDLSVEGIAKISVTEEEPKLYTYEELVKGYRL